MSLPIMATSSWVAWRGFVLQMRESSRSPVALTAGFLQPLAYLTMLLSRPAPDPVYARTVIVGVALISVWSLMLWSAGTALLRDRLGGTLETILARPGSLGAVLAGRMFAVALVGLGTSGAAVMCVLSMRGLAVPVPDAVVLLLLAPLTAASAAALGALLAALVLVLRGAVRILEFAAFPVLILGGLLIPVALLPAGLRWPAELVSLYHLGVMAVAGQLEAVRLVQAAALSVAYGAAAAVLLRVTLRRARVRGTLGRA